MNDVIKLMLQKYEASTSEQFKQALKEIIQEIALLGLSRAKFFEHAAFYGGTALRIFHNLDRFSEDLDFSLLTSMPEFDLHPYCHFVKAELESYGFSVTVNVKRKSKNRQIQSAFIKANTLIHLIKIETLKNPKLGTHPNERLKVKFEVDCHPPAKAGFSVQFMNQPIPFSVKLFDKPSLFAGKIHAMLFRKLGANRVKGRDIYDFIWMALQKTPLNLPHLEMRMRQTGDWDHKSPLEMNRLSQMINEFANSVDLNAAKADVITFLSRPESTDAWSPALIRHAFRQIPKD